MIRHLREILAETPLPVLLADVVATAAFAALCYVLICAAGVLA